MPTNILRNRNSRVTAPSAATRPPRKRAAAPRVIRVTAGSVAFEATLLDTPAADRIWAALPLFSVAETWGKALHFELPLESGRERQATSQAQAGTLYYWSEEDRVIVAFGQTPLSRPGEMRLPLPCSPLATTTADLTLLSRVKGGQKVTLKKA